MGTVVVALGHPVGLNLGRAPGHRFRRAHRFLPPWYQAEKLGTNLDESLAAAERALELAGPDPLLRAMVIDTVGWVHYKRSELEAAKQCVEEAVRLNDTSLYVRNHLAVLNSTVRAAV